MATESLASGTSSGVPSKGTQGLIDIGSPAAKGVLQAWRYREQVSRALLMAAQSLASGRKGHSSEEDHGTDSGSGSDSSSDRQRSRVNALGMALAATCWAVALAPQCDAPVQLLGAFAPSGTDPARLSLRGVVLAAVSNFHGVCSASRRTAASHRNRSSGRGRGGVEDRGGGGAERFKVWRQ